MQPVQCGGHASERVQPVPVSGVSIAAAGAPAPAPAAGGAPSAPAAAAPVAALPDIPVFSLCRIERLRDRLYDEVFTHAVDCLVSADTISRFVALLRPRIVGASTAALTESVRYLAGSMLTRREAVTLAWRLAGNVERLRAGRPVGQWTGQAVDEWVPVSVLRAIESRGAKGTFGHVVDFRVLAGSPCPLRVSAFWPSRLSSLVASRIGFSRPWGSFRYMSPLELVGLRLVVQVSRARSRQQPVFGQIADPQPGWVTAWNRKTVLRVRCRVDPCPFGYVHRCKECVVGRDQCVAAVHPVTFEQRACRFCGKADAFFDSDRDATQCVECCRRAAAARRGS